mgnify:CR=1 FL=1
MANCLTDAKAPCGWIDQERDGETFPSDKELRGRVQRVDAEPSMPRAAEARGNFVGGHAPKLSETFGGIVTRYGLTLRTVSRAT